MLSSCFVWLSVLCQFNTFYFFFFFNLYKNVLQLYTPAPYTHTPLAPFRRRDNICRMYVTLVIKYSNSIIKHITNSSMFFFYILVTPKPTYTKIFFSTNLSIHKYDAEICRFRTVNTIYSQSVHLLIM